MRRETILNKYKSIEERRKFATFVLSSILRSLSNLPKERVTIEHAEFMIELAEKIEQLQVIAKPTKEELDDMVQFRIENFNTHGPNAEPVTVMWAFDLANNYYSSSSSYSNKKKKRRRKKDGKHPTNRKRS